MVAWPCKTNPLWCTNLVLIWVFIFTAVISFESVKLQYVSVLKKLTNSNFYKSITGVFFLYAYTWRVQLVIFFFFVLKPKDLFCSFVYWTFLSALHCWEFAAFNTFVLALFLAVAFYSILNILHLYNLFFSFLMKTLLVICAFFHRVHFLRSFALESPLVFYIFLVSFLESFWVMWVMVWNLILRVHTIVTLCHQLIVTHFAFTYAHGCAKPFVEPFLW